MVAASRGKIVGGEGFIAALVWSGSSATFRPRGIIRCRKAIRWSFRASIYCRTDLWCAGRRIETACRSGRAL